MPCLSAVGLLLCSTGSKAAGDYAPFLEAAGLKLTEEEERAGMNKNNQTRLLEAKAVALGLPSRSFFKDLPVSCFALHMARRAVQ